MNSFSKFSNTFLVFDIRHSENFLLQKQDEIDSASSGSVRPKVQFDVPATTTKVSPNPSNVKAKLDFLTETSGGANQQQSRFVGLNGGPAPQVMMGADHQVNPVGRTTFPTASDSVRGSHYPSTSAHNLRMPPMSQFPPRPPIPSIPGLTANSIFSDCKTFDLPLTLISLVPGINLKCLGFGHFRYFLRALLSLIS